MRMTYTPEGAEPRHWDFRFQDMDSAEVEAIEDETGIMFGDWEARYKSMRLIHGLLWNFLRRDTPDLAYDSVRFKFSEIGFTETPKPKKSAAGKA